MIYRRKNYANSHIFDFMNAISETNFRIPGQESFYRGKVRDVYDIGDRLIIVATDRISAFDHILPRAIPFKGQVLNQIATYFLQCTDDIVPNWLESVPDPNVAVGIKCKPIKIEMVIRGYLTGHAWREYNAGRRSLCGVKMPEKMRQNDPFPEPIITPATKAEAGHDEDISREDILKKGILDEQSYTLIESYTRNLFKRGSEMAARRGLILVDTKYEFGTRDEEIYLIDEIHTPDSSRYFYLDGYQERQDKGKLQEQLSKEFVREWLMLQGFQGKEGQRMPAMPDEFVSVVSERYIDLYERMTGNEFIRSEDEDPVIRIETNILQYLQAM
jgi:phosphoribosylaminoimidazole-succinocarboxamide synthase